MYKTDMGIIAGSYNILFVCIDSLRFDEHQRKKATEGRLF